jgi:predicted metal-dependent hydrolase
MMVYPVTAVQLNLPFLQAGPRDPLVSPSRQDAPPVEFVRMRRARRYILRVRSDGTLRVTIPRGGSRREAEAFLREHRRWAERERQRVLVQHAPAEWHEGDEILLRGLRVALRIDRSGGRPFLVYGNRRRALPRSDGDTGNLRPIVEEDLRELARVELVPRLLSLAAAHSLTVVKVIVRNQQSRWGSCSRAGSIALNFRLVQMPDAVRDYVLLHELMHLKQQNHSRRFWRLVEQVCPRFREAERWLRVEGKGLF